jgi:hypothetical protein
MSPEPPETVFCAIAACGNAKAALTERASINLVVGRIFFP